MAKKTNGWMIATFILIGVLVLGLITGFIVLGTKNSCSPNNQGQYCYDENYLVNYRDFYDCVKDGLINSQRLARNELRNYDTISQSDWDIFSNTIDFYFDDAPSLGCYSTRP